MADVGPVIGKLISGRITESRFRHRPDVGRLRNAHCRYRSHRSSREYHRRAHRSYLNRFPRCTRNSSGVALPLANSAPGHRKGVRLRDILRRRGLKPQPDSTNPSTLPAIARPGHRDRGVGLLILTSQILVLASSLVKTPSFDSSSAEPQGFCWRNTSSMVIFFFGKYWVYPRRNICITSPLLLGLRRSGFQFRNTCRLPLFIQVS